MKWKYNLNFLLVCFALVFSVFHAKGQEAILQGFVKDHVTSEPLIAANIILCDQLVVSDFEGKFEIPITQENCDLIISYVGYISYSEPLNQEILSKDDFIIFLEESNNILEQTVISASKFAEKKSTSTSTLELLDPGMLSRASVTSVDEAIDMLPGVDIIDGQANIRGGSGYSYGAGSRVLLVLDGMPALQYDGGFPNWDDIPTESISRVEVLKGASSVLYGASALNGVINVKTNTTAQKEPITKVGSYLRLYLSPKEIERKWWGDTLQPFESNSYLYHSQKLGKVDMSISGIYHKLSSFNQSVEKDRGRARLTLQYFPKKNVQLKLNSQINLIKQSNFFYWGNAFRKSFQPTPAVIATTGNIRFNIDPYLTIYTANNNKHELKGRYYHIDNDSNEGRGILTDQFYLNYQYHHNFKNWSGEMVVGADGSYNHTIAPLFGFAEYSGNNASIYGQYTHLFLDDKLKWNIGARLEHYQITNPEFSYEVDSTYTILAGTESEIKPVFRSGLNYQIAEGTYIRASIGQGYRYPTIAEKYTATSFGSFTVIPNPSLESETGISTEIGVRQEFLVKNVVGFVDVAGFYSKYFNMMEFGLNQDFGAAFQAQNIGDTRISGIEASVGWQLTFGELVVQGMGGYTYISPIYLDFEKVASTSTSEENILKYRYNHSFKSNITIKAFNWEFWVMQRYNSEMKAIDRIFNDFIPGIEGFRAVYDTGYNIWSTQLAYSYKFIKTSVNMDNAFNRLYTERPGLLQAPRNVTFKVGFTF